jgi:hypothetical protein
MGVFGAASSLWWFWRTYHAFSGDFLGVKTGLKVFAPAAHQSMDYQKPPWQVVTSIRWWRFIFFSFWGLFGYMTRWMWRPIYLDYLGVFVLAIAGWMKTKVVRPPVPRSQLVQPAIWLLFAACALVNLVALLCMQFGGPQGRYFFISEIPLIALMLEGLRRLGPRWGPRTIVGFLAFNIIVCLGVWVMLFRLYGLPGYWARLPY